LVILSSSQSFSQQKENERHAVSNFETTIHKVKDGLNYAEVEEKKRKEERNTLMQHVACKQINLQNVSNSNKDPHLTGCALE
jgi:hypothetical protein